MLLLCLQLIYNQRFLCVWLFCIFLQCSDARSRAVSAGSKKGIHKKQSGVQGDALKQTIHNHLFGVQQWVWLGSTHPLRLPARKNS